MKIASMKEGLRYYSGFQGLSPQDREHLERWQREHSDPIWEELAAAIRKHEDATHTGMGFPYVLLIAFALRARRGVESLPENPKDEARQRKEQLERRREELDLFADQIQRIVLKLEIERLSLKLHEPDERTSTEEAFVIQWLKTRLADLRKDARRVAESRDRPVPDFRGIIRRQSGGEGKHPRSRELAYFSVRMVKNMLWFCGSPRHEAVATMANIAFPDATLTGEMVRSFCRPTTRTARRANRVSSSKRKN